MKNIYLYFTFCLLIIVLNRTSGQDTCSAPTLTLYGLPDKDERGKSLVSNSLNDGIYVAGFKSDSVLLFESTLDGVIKWAKTMDIIPGRPDHASAIIRDDENMLVVSGMAGDQGSGGVIFCFRYDPFNQKILWAQEYFTATRNYSFTLIQNGSDKNYLLVNNPHEGGNNDYEILLLEKSTGDVLNNLSRNYNYGGSDQITDLVYHKNFIYGTGRFTEGSSLSQMRHTLIKADPIDGNVEWIKMGHVPQSQEARLYGWDLIIENDEIYSIYSGDPTGASSGSNKLFLQKTDLDGKLLWLKRYELPGQSDDGYELIRSGSGIVVLAGTSWPGEGLILFKIDFNGNLLWAKQFSFSALNSTEVDRGTSQLIEIGNQLIFTAVGIMSNGRTDLVLVKTDLSGNMQPDCITNQDVQVQVVPLINPVFVSISPDDFAVTPPKRNKTVNPVATTLINNSFCVIEDTLINYVSAVICEGQSYLGYTNEGQYSDHFVTPAGCDSVRFLELSVITELFSEEEIKICLGDTINGLYTTGIYTDTFTSVGGCDSIAFLILEVEAIEEHLNIEICFGGAYGNYSAPGLYTDTITGSGLECDTIRHIDLSVAPIITNSIAIVLCEGDNYNGYSLPGTYIDTFTTFAGCDSIAIVDLSSGNSISTSITAAICEHPEYSLPGTYIDSFSSTYGCDSIRTLTLSGAAKYVPNVFTPNGDGINDRFEVFVFPENSFRLDYFAIFDRFGDMVYETTSWPILWDGAFKGQPFMPGVFTYMLKYYCGNKIITEYGSITLIQ